MILLRVFAICTPLAGLFFSPLVALLIVIGALLCKGGTALYSVTLGIPTLIATLCWITEQKTTRAWRLAHITLNVILPLACMLAFFLHPVGRQSFAYALYWLIPPIIFAHANLLKGVARGERCNPAKLLAKPGQVLIMGSTISATLRITFITHAIGSTLWIYTVPTTPIYWLALIPIVAIERLCLAGSTTAIISVVKIIEHAFDKFSVKT